MSECESCVKGEFVTIKRLTFIILIVILGSGFWGVLVDSAQGEKDHAQDQGIALTIQRLNAFENMMSDTNRQLGDVINLIRDSNKMQNALNIRLETHIARGE